MSSNDANFSGKEVSCRTIEVLFQALSTKGLPATALTTGTDYTVAHRRDQAAQIAWADYWQIMANASHIWDEAELVDLGRNSSESLLLPKTLAVVPFFSSVPPLYHLILESESDNPLFYACQCTSGSDPAAKDLVVTHPATNGYPPAPAHFYMLKGVLAVIPKLAGFGPAEVGLVAVEDGFRYEIGLRRSMGILTKLRRFMRLPLVWWITGRNWHRVSLKLQEKYGMLPTQPEVVEGPAPGYADFGSDNSTNKSQAVPNESQRRLQALFDYAQEAVLLFDDQGYLVDANPAACNLFGYRREELLGMQVLNLSPFAVLGQSRQRWQQFKATRHQAGEYTFQCRDGSMVEIEYRAVANIIPGLHQAVARDITAQKQTMATLKLSEDRYRSLLEDMPGLLCRFNPDGIIEFVNETYAHTFGQNVEDLIGQSFITFIPPADRAEVTAGLEALTLASPVMTHKHQVIDAQGELRWYRWVSRLLTDELGQVVAYQAFGLDITERTQARAELRQSQTRLQLALDASAVGTWNYEIEADLVYADGRLARLFGVDPQQAAAGLPLANFLQAMHEDDRPMVEAQIERAIQTGERYMVEYRVLDDAGRCRWVVAQGQPERDGSGKVTQFPGAVADITELKRAKEALQESQDRLRLLLEHAPFGIQLYEMDGTLVQVNRTWEMMWNARSEDVVGKYNALQDPQLDAIGLREFVDQAFAGKEMYFPDTHYVSAQGRGRWVRAYCYHIPDSTGQIRHLVLISEDVTERKQAEQSVRQADSQRQALIHSVDGIVWEADPETLAFLFVSDQAERLLGYPVRQWLEEQTFWVDHIHPADREAALSYCRACTREKRNHEFEYRTIAADGRIVWLRDMVTVVVEADRAVKLRGIMVDITEQKAAEAAVRESESRFRQLAENIDGVFWITSPTKNQVLYVSPAYEKIWGRSCETLYSSPQDWLNAIHPADRERVEKVAVPDLNKGEYDEEYRLIQPDGTVRWIHDRAFRVSAAEGEVDRIVGVAQDITKRKEAEAQVRRSLAEKQLLLQEIHHRVKNNLQLISSMLSLQSDMVDDEAVRAIFVKSQRRIRSLALIHEELYRSKDLTYIYFADHIRNLVSYLYQSYGANERHIMFENQISHMPLNADQAIPCSLIINELISNALKYAFPVPQLEAMDEPPTISVSLTAMPNQMHCLTVCDNGVGLPPGLAVDQLNSLGLRLIQALARQMDGTFDYQGEAGVTCKIQFKVENIPSHGQD